MAMLEIRDLEVNYGAINAIKKISFDVNQGEVVAPEDKLMALYKKANQEMGLGNNTKVIELLEKIIQILINLSLEFNLYIDGYELNKRLEKIKNKNRFATNGG